MSRRGRATSRVLVLTAHVVNPAPRVRDGFDPGRGRGTSGQASPVTDDRVQGSAGDAPDDQVCVGSVSVVYQGHEEEGSGESIGETSQTSPGSEDPLELTGGSRQGHGEGPSEVVIAGCQSSRPAPGRTPE